MIHTEFVVTNQSVVTGSKKSCVKRSRVEHLMSMAKRFFGPNKVAGPLGSPMEKGVPSDY